MIHTVLIANRGEIACRIIATCRRLGLRTVAVFSNADANARHVQLADTAVYLGSPPAVESYLHIEKIVAAAHRAGADAIHPGFGFLAENADFARACIQAGLIFIGPAPEAIEMMGHKQAAKARVAQAGVPTIPGYGGHDQSDERFQGEAAGIGYPVMIKAAAGGGGKGMRLIAGPETLTEALATARREAQQAFGVDELLLEKALSAPRHVEVQVVGDQHGGIIHLGERECSIQRRHQKVIEETPSTAVWPELRAEMGAAAVAVARTVNYDNVGTVEFLLAEDGRFYFLEMNTRLQVEHPVTEMVTGIDLVEWQIRIAEGERLPLSQQQVQMNGHAIEARLYAENPAHDFLPVTGAVRLWRPPTGEGVRVDSGIQTGDVVSVHYDPLLAKVIAHGPDRKTAVRRLLRALETAVLLGFTHNAPFLQAVLRHPAFQAGQTNIHFISRHLARWQPDPVDVPLALMAVTLVQFHAHPRPEIGAGFWRNNFNQPQTYRYALPGQESPLEVYLTPPARGGNTYRLTLCAAPEEEWQVQLNEHSGPELTLMVNGHRQRVTAVVHNDQWWAQTETGVVHCRALPLLPEPQLSPGAAGSLRAPMPGLVLAVLVKVGQRVNKGQALLKLEAMKMEHTIHTNVDGIVEEIYFAPGDTVEADAQLIKIRDD